MDAIELVDLMLEHGIVPVPCQCCGYPTEGFGDVCINCGWEQVDSEEVEDENSYVDANYSSLKEYKKKVEETK